VLKTLNPDSFCAGRRGSNGPYLGGRNNTK
jgi:hypothetical protein